MHESAELTSLLACRAGQARQGRHPPRRLLLRLLPGRSCRLPRRHNLMLRLLPQSPQLLCPLRLHRRQRCLRLLRTLCGGRELALQLAHAPAQLLPAAGTARPRPDRHACSGASGKALLPAKTHRAAVPDRSAVQTAVPRQYHCSTTASCTPVCLGVAQLGPGPPRRRLQLPILAGQLLTLRPAPGSQPDSRWAH